MISYPYHHSVRIENRTCHPVVVFASLLRVELTPADGPTSHSWQIAVDGSRVDCQTCAHRCHTHSPVTPEFAPSSSEGVPRDERADELYVR